MSIFNEPLTVGNITWLATIAAGSIWWTIRQQIVRITNNALAISKTDDDVMNVKQEVQKLEGKNDVYNEIITIMRKDIETTKESINDINVTLTAIKIMLAEHVAKGE